MMIYARWLTLTVAAQRTALAVALLSSGCTMTVAHIDIPYQPATNASPIAGASAATVSISVTDGRGAEKDRVMSWDTETLFWPHAQIVATNDVPTTVGKAVEQQLTAQGFKIGHDHAVMLIEVTKFHCDRETHSWGFEEDYTAQVALDVKVIGPSNAIEFSKPFDGNAKESRKRLLSWSSDVRAALMKALQTAVDTIVGDHELQAALLAAQ